MTLKAALKLLKKNPSWVLKQDTQYYYIVPKGNHEVPVMAKIYTGAPNELGNSWENGFAYVTVSDISPVALAASLENLTTKNWEVIDLDCVCSNIARVELADYIKHFDEINKYHVDKSVYGQELLEKGNTLLKEINNPCALEFDSSASYVTYKLTAPENTDAKERFIATKHLIYLVRQLTKDNKNVLKVKSFEDNHPKDKIVIKKVTMKEFLERIQTSKKLWYIDATNATKYNKNKVCERDWNKARLRFSKLERSTYGGARTDRLSSRNSLTNQIGLPVCKGSAFYSLEDLDNCGGTFFADVVSGYGEYYLILDDNVLLDLRHSLSISDINPELGYGALQPQVKKSYSPIVKILNRRFSSFEEFSKR